MPDKPHISKAEIFKAFGVDPKHPLVKKYSKMIKAQRKVEKEMQQTLINSLSRHINLHEMTPFFVTKFFCEKCRCTWSLTTTQNPLPDSSFIHQICNTPVMVIGLNSPTITSWEDWGTQRNQPLSEMKRIFNDVQLDWNENNNGSWEVDEAKIIITF